MKRVLFVSSLLVAVGCGELPPLTGQTEAQGKSDCAHCCVATFPPGPERGLCMSEAAHGTGPCICGTQCCVGARDLSTPPPPADLATTD